MSARAVLPPESSNRPGTNVSTEVPDAISMVVRPDETSIDDSDTSSPLAHDTHIKLAKTRLQRLRSPMMTTGLALCISVLAMVIGFALLLVSKPWSSSNSTTQQDDAAVALQARKTNGAAYWAALHQHIRGGTNPNSKSPLAALPPLRRGSPQWQALDWMVRFDPLAVLYFSWHGPTLWTLTTPTEGWLGYVAAASSDQAVLFSEGLTTAETRVPVPLHECEWLGIECNTQQQIEKLEIPYPSFVVRGRVPAELGLLSHLLVLDLSDHSLQGRLPLAMYSGLTALTKLDVSVNQFTGFDDTALAQWSNLRIFNCQRNLLRGVFPVRSLQGWKELRSIDFSVNDELSGRVWQDGVPHWHQLEYLGVASTRISGSIPQLEDGTLSQIREISATSSDLTGTLPASLALATHLTAFTANDLSGVGLTPRQMPTEFGALTNLVRFVVETPGALSGSLPTEIGRWTNLVILDIGSNEGLIGTLPTELGRLTALNQLKVSETSLSGTIPTEIGMLKQLVDMQLHSTKMTGHMPEEICTLQIAQLTADCQSFVSSSGESTPKLECLCCSICF
jgi:Leucine-rich repeat (LRR) protein